MKKSVFFASLIVCLMFLASVSASSYGHYNYDDEKTVRILDYKAKPDVVHIQTSMYTDYMPYRINDKSVRYANSQVFLPIAYQKQIIVKDDSRRYQYFWNYMHNRQKMRIRY